MDGKLCGEIANFLLEAARIGAATVKDFNVDVALLPGLQRFADTLNIPVTTVFTAVGGDVIHVEVTPTLQPEVKAGGAVA